MFNDVKTECEAYQVYLMFHRAWSNAVGTPEYQKQYWKFLEELMAQYFVAKFGHTWMTRGRGSST
jgi:hypothetical protein